jgi:IMP dehydrogenase
LFREVLAFDDVLLVPKRSNIASRNDVDISTELFPGIKLEFPVLSANMATVTGENMAYTMANAEGLGVIHRMQSIENEAQMITNVRRTLEATSLEDEFIGFSFGVQDDWEERVSACVVAGGDIAVLDVAHANHTHVTDIVRSFLEIWNVPLIVGNIADIDAAHAVLVAAYFDYKRIALKVGIGGGSMCTTRIVTGCGIPTFQSVYDIHRELPDAKLIADGGIKNSGDIVKALAAGASAVMVGSMLAATSDTPGAVINHADGTSYKLYRGSASYGDKEARGEEIRNIEGVETLVPYKGSTWDVIKRARENIRSGFSYVGARNLAELQARAEFVKITSNGLRESQPHGKT